MLAHQLAQRVTVQPLLVVQASCLPLWRSVPSHAGKMPAPQSNASGSAGQFNPFYPQCLVSIPATPYETGVGVLPAPAIGRIGSMTV